MKRFILLMLLCGFGALLLCGCSSRELTEEEIEQREMIQKFLGIELPEKCEMVSYEYTLNDEKYGGEICILIKTNKNGKNNIIQQLEDNENQKIQYSLSESVSFDELEQIPLDKEDLRAVYYASGRSRNLDLDYRVRGSKHVFIAKDDRDWLIYLIYHEEYSSHI